MLLKSPQLAHQLPLTARLQGSSVQHLGLSCTSILAVATSPEQEIPFSLDAFLAVDDLCIEVSCTEARPRSEGGQRI